jgi:hypothetical protein
MVLVLDLALYIIYPVDEKLGIKVENHCQSLEQLFYGIMRNTVECVLDKL